MVESADDLDILKPEINTLLSLRHKDDGKSLLMDESSFVLRVEELLFDFLQPQKIFFNVFNRLRLKNR